VKIVLENRVELDVVAEVDVKVLLGGAGGPEHTRAQEHRCARGARCSGYLPGRHTDGKEPRCDPTLFVQLEGLGADRADPSTSILQSRRLAHEVGELGEQLLA